MNICMNLHIPKQFFGINHVNFLQCKMVIVFLNHTEKHWSLGFVHVCLNFAVIKAKGTCIKCIDIFKPILPIVQQCNDIVMRVIYICWYLYSSLKIHSCWKLIKWKAIVSHISAFLWYVIEQCKESMKRDKLLLILQIYSKMVSQGFFLFGSPRKDWIIVVF